MNEIILSEATIEQMRASGIVHDIYKLLASHRALHAKLEAADNYLVTCPWVCGYKGSGNAVIDMSHVIDCGTRQLHVAQERVKQLEGVPKPPYKEWCRTPETCRGLSSCPLDPTCAD